MVKKRLAVYSCIALCSLCAIAAIWLLNGPRPSKTQDDLFSDPLGMVLIDIADEKAAASYHVEQLGVYVLAVHEQGQAYAAGVRSGDRLVRVNGHPVRSTSEFVKTQETFRVPQRVWLDFHRGPERRPLTAELLWSMEFALQ